MMAMYIEKAELYSIFKVAPSIDEATILPFRTRANSSKFATKPNTLNLLLQLLSQWCGEVNDLGKLSTKPIRDQAIKGAKQKSTIKKSSVQKSVAVLLLIKFDGTQMASTDVITKNHLFVMFLGSRMRASKPAIKIDRADKPITKLANSSISTF
jgi:hypothetical protein